MDADDPEEAGLSRAINHQRHTGTVLLEENFDRRVVIAVSSRLSLDEP
jgi:hypothetical protein